MEVTALFITRRTALALGAAVAFSFVGIVNNAHAFDFGCIDLPTGGQFCFNDSSSSSSAQSSQSSVSSSTPASSSSSQQTSSASSQSSTSSTTSSTSTSSTSSSSSVGGGSTGGGSGGGSNGGSAPTCYGKTATVYVNGSNVIVGGPDDGQTYAGELNGTSGDDVIFGTNGADDIYGKDGNDTICANGGDDQVDGGDENDVVFGGEGNDVIDGKSDDDILCGEAGNDIIEGGFGDDTLCGGDGNDDLEGGAGADKLDGGAGTDILDGRTGTDLCIGGESTSSCDTTVGSVDCPVSGASSASSTSSSSSVSSTSSSSSSSSSSNSGGGSTNNPPVNVSTVSGGGSGGNGSGGGGSRTRPLEAALNFLSNYYQRGVTRPAGILNLASGGFGGNEDLTLSIGPLSGRDVPRGTPFSGVEKRLTCNLIKTIDRNADSPAERTKMLTDQWVATLLAQMLGRNVTDIRRIFRDPEFCKGFEGSVMRDDSADSEEVALEDHGPMTFVLATDGAPLVEGDDMFSTVWNNCVRNKVTRREDGKIYNCSRYQVESTLWGGRKWIHPLLGIEFGWNYRTHRIVFSAADYQNGEGIIIVQRETPVALQTTTDAE